MIILNKLFMCSIFLVSCTGTQFTVTTVGGCNFLGQCGIDYGFTESDKEKEGGYKECNTTLLNYLTGSQNKDFLPYVGKKICRM